MEKEDHMNDDATVAIYPDAERTMVMTTPEPARPSHVQPSGRGRAVTRGVLIAVSALLLFAIGALLGANAIASTTHTGAELEQARQEAVQEGYDDGYGDGYDDAESAAAGVEDEAYRSGYSDGYQDGVKDTVAEAEEAADDKPSKPAKD